jgi:hypothetical protein
MVIDEYRHLVVRLPAAGYGTTEFDMSEDRRAALVEAGRTAMASYSMPRMTCCCRLRGKPRPPARR